MGCLSQRAVLLFLLCRCFLLCCGCGFCGRLFGSCGRCLILKCDLFPQFLIDALVIVPLLVCILRPLFIYLLVCFLLFFLQKRTLGCGKLTLYIRVEHLDDDIRIVCLDYAADLILL